MLRCSHFEELQLRQFYEQEVSVPQALYEWCISGYFREPDDVVPQENGVSMEIVKVPVVRLEKGVSVENGVPVVPKEKGISAEQKEVSVEKKAIFVQGKGISAEACFGVSKIPAEYPAMNTGSINKLSFRPE